MDIGLCVDIRTCGCWVLCGDPHMWILRFVWISARVDIGLCVDICSCGFFFRYPHKWILGFVWISAQVDIGLRVDIGLCVDTHTCGC